MEFIKDFPLLAQIYFLSLVVIFGMIIGSFLNVVALRFLSGESIVFPPSKCPHCKTPLKWYDNIPVFAYVFLLGGKCRYCKEKISIQYPLVEVSTGLIFLGIFCQHSLSAATVFLMVLAAALIVMTITDLKEKVIFDVISFPLIPLGLIYNYFNFSHAAAGTVTLWGISFNEVFISALIGTIIGAVIFELMAATGYIFAGQRAFGEGDSIIAAGLGAFFGWQYLLYIIGLSFVFQLIVGIPVVINNMYKEKDFESIRAMGLMLLALAIPYISRITGFSDNIIIALAITIIAFGLAIYGMKVILTNAQKRESYTFLPFGPALVFGAFVMMFWGEKIMRMYF